VAEAPRQLAGRQVSTALRGGRRGPVQGVSPGVEAGAGEERAPEAVQAEPSSLPISTTIIIIYVYVCVCIYIHLPTAKMYLRSLV